MKYENERDSLENEIEEQEQNIKNLNDEIKNIKNSTELKILQKDKKNAKFLLNSYFKARINYFL